MSPGPASWTDHTGINLSVVAIGVVSGAITGLPLSWSLESSDSPGPRAGFWTIRNRITVTGAIILALLFWVRVGLQPCGWLERLFTRSECIYVPLESATVGSLVFSPDGETLVTGPRHNDVCAWVWRVDDGALLHTLPEEGNTPGLALSPDGKVMASLAYTNVRLWRVSDWKLLRSLDGHAHRATSVAFSPSGTLVASGDRDGVLRLWRVSNGSLLLVLPGRGSIEDVEWSPNGRIIATASGDGLARLWRVSDGALLHALEHKYSPYSAVFSPDGRLLASTNASDAVWLWRVSDGALVHELTGPGSRTNPTFSPDGKTLALGANDTAELWRVSDGTLLHVMKGHTGVSSLAFSPDGTTLAAGSHQGFVRLWQVQDLIATQQTPGKSANRTTLIIVLCVGILGVSLLGAAFLFEFRARQRR